MNYYLLPLEYHELILNPYVFPILICVIVFIGLELLTVIVSILFSSFNRIPVKGKHLDELSQTDWLYITINKFLTALFVYHAQYVILGLKTIKWRIDEMSFSNTVVSWLLFYLFYDFFYMSFHRFLHLRAIYGFVHKHHHRQKAPSRGNLDAINVHPFEYIVGEYLHLVTIYFIPSHISAVLLFILMGGILASLNHTRFDVSIPYLYSVKVHDVHHRLPESNYAQYTMLWDCLFGTYRSYDKYLNVEAKDD